jgi:hypothetical protein
LVQAHVDGCHLAAVGRDPEVNALNILVDVPSMRRDLLGPDRF